jgi:hypothetical protein
MARAVESRNQAESRLKEVSSQYKAEINRHNAEISECAVAINAGKIHRKVECLRTQNWLQGMVRVTRIDTAEVISERAMLPEERQQRLWFEKQDKTDRSGDLPAQDPDAPVPGNVDPITGEILFPDPELPAATVEEPPEEAAQQAPSLPSPPDPMQETELPPPPSAEEDNVRNVKRPRK